MLVHVVLQYVLLITRSGSDFSTSANVLGCSSVVWAMD